MTDPITEAGLAASFKALGDPTRLRIFEYLRQCEGPVSVDESGDARCLAGPTVGEVCCTITGIDRVTSTVSHHLKELRQAGLIQMERRGKQRICSIDPAHVAAIAAYLSTTPEPCCTPKENPVTTISLTDREDVRSLVRQKYGEAALTVLEGKGAASCCGGGSSSSSCSDNASTSCCGGDSITGDLYSQSEAGEIPEAALLASLGCGNPTALASLAEGETVLDLGSGGGIDVLLSARRVGPTGFAYGLDMTDEMLALAEKNKAESGATNVKFLKGHIEEIPLPDGSVDVVISNCVINLSADKDAVLREAFRVLKPGGRFAVSDVVVDGEIPAAVRADMEAYVGCVAGALERTDYLAKLAVAGFQDATIEPTRRYLFADLEAETCTSAAVAALPPDEKAQLDGRIMGAFIRAVKPGA